MNHDRVEIDWITVSSYGDSTTSSGVIRMLKEPDLDLDGRNVLVIAARLTTTPRGSSVLQWCP